MAERLLRLLRFFAPQTAFSHRLNRGENMTIDEFLTNVRRIQAADPRYRLGRDGSDGYCDCIGLVIGAIRRSGGQWRGIHGTNWTARNAMHDLNPLRAAGQLRRGELVFRAHEPGAKGYALPSRYASSAGILPPVKNAARTLCSGSIRDNLRWGRETADDAAIEEAAKLACADSFIGETENGYDTLLGQGGVNLSGGQKQRLALARALVRKPKVLILDDCTSALDAQTEAEVLRGLHKLSGETTVLLISQRIYTVMKADRILCLADGRIQGFGAHEELMASCAPYRAIYESQIGGEDNGR